MTRKRFGIQKTLHFLDISCTTDIPQYSLYNYHTIKSCSEPVNTIKSVLSHDLAPVHVAILPIIQMKGALALVREGPCT